MDIRKIENEACKKALAIKSCGYNCAQAVIGSLAEHVDLDRDNALRLMAAFGGGMRHQQLCGALLAAGMALSWKFGSADVDKDIDDHLGELTVKLVDAFKESNKTTTCKELLESDLSEFKWDMQMESPADNANKQYDNPYNIKAPICGKAITDAVKIALNILYKTDS